MNTWPPIMSIRRARDWFRVSGFTIAVDHQYLPLEWIDEKFKKISYQSQLCLLAKRRPFCAPGNLFLTIRVNFDMFLTS